MIFVYGDESMDEKKERVCAVAAVVGTQEQWEAIEGKWVERSAGIPFHANNCDSDQGDYEGKEHKDNKALYRDLAVMLAASGLHGFSVAIDLIAQAKVLPGVDPSDLRSKTYYIAFSEVLQGLTNFSQIREDVAELTFDSRIGSEHNAALLYANIRELEPNCTAHLAPRLIFDSSKTNPRLQMADLFAREAMKALDNVIGPVQRKMRKSWKALEDTGRFVVAPYSTEWFSYFVGEMTLEDAQMGFDREEYKNWLGDRQENLTAFIEYTKLRFPEVKAVVERMGNRNSERTK
ncbi:MAG: hypothetical protein ABR987_17945 [Terracidiphilus sp.]|jgi:hypothetical protein